MIEAQFGDEVGALTVLDAPKVLESVFYTVRFYARDL